MPLKRKHGWRKDEAAFTLKYAPHARLVDALRASALPPLAAADHRPFRGERLYQGGVGSCFAFDVARRFQLWNAMVRQATFLASPRAIYWAARAQEFAGQDPEDVASKMTDSGSYPALGYQAIAAVGFIAWDDCPYPTGANEWDPVSIAQIVSEPPPPAVWEKAYAQRGLETAKISSTGLDRVRAVAELLQKRCPVGFGMDVDVAFEQNAGGLISSINPRLIQGGHAIPVLAITDSSGKAIGADDVSTSSQVVFDNWWEDWGAADGTGRMSATLFGSDTISDVTAATFVPEAQ